MKNTNGYNNGKEPQRMNRKQFFELIRKDYKFKYERCSLIDKVNGPHSYKVLGMEIYSKKEVEELFNTMIEDRSSKVIYTLLNLMPYSHIEVLEADKLEEIEKLEAIQKQWDEVTLTKVFEEEVFNKRTQEQDYIIFDISINGNFFIAQHIALTTAQEQSKKIACVQWEIDTDFSLDENLNVLHELCINAVIDSEFFNLK